MSELELWAGVEASGVRIGDTYADQLEWTGHAHRLDDIERIASLGVKKVRFPVLWERTARPDGSFAWSFSDERLARLRALGIDPIIGLVHHGSGPRHTNLLEDSFVTGLADFARAVAERYPWVTSYTPVNEPLTTARFSALYGHWYPHACDVRSFLRALLVECRAVRAAMSAIRGVVPAARLIQTEDFATVTSTSELAYQARFENSRRFLSLDLLTGRVTREHPLRAWVIEHGLDDAALDDLEAQPCPPDLIGMNYYVTSDRFLDHRVTGYPADVVGGNGIHTYADVEAVRAQGARLGGHRSSLEALWERYRRPLAITEVHLGADSEDQIRWLHDAWLAAVIARRDGVDVRAVTLWSVFGSFDWDSLLRLRRGHYEPGAFDVRAGAVRPTALAKVACDLASTGMSNHPLLADPGWWRRADRIRYPIEPQRAVRSSGGTARPILVIGACPILTAAISRASEARGIAVAVERAVPHDAGGVLAAIERHRAWAVIDATSDREVLADPRLGCPGSHVERAARIAEACHTLGLRHVAFSSDLVFDGSKGSAYVEADEPTPFDSYGESKVLAERAILDLCPDAVVVRTGTLFGHGRSTDFVERALDALGAGRTFRTTSELCSPTYVPDAAEALLTLLVDGAAGVWHLSSGMAVTWLEFARSACTLANIETNSLVECSAQAATPAQRSCAIASERGSLLRKLDEALASCVGGWRARHAARISG